MWKIIDQRRRDEASDAYANWREQCFGVEAAYERWARARRAHAGVAYREYQDALDREEHASVQYALLVP